MSEDKQLTPTAEEIEGIKRLSMTYDGRLLHRFFRRVLEGYLHSVDASALLANNGRRSLAFELMAHMAEGIESSGGRTGSSSDDQPILSRPGGGARVVSPRDTRRVSLVHGDGWDAFDSSGNPIDPARKA